MLIETEKLEGAALDWAVAKASNTPVKIKDGMLLLDVPKIVWVYYTPSRDWGQGDPIIEQESISFREYYRPGAAAHGTFYARVCRESGQMVFWSRKTSSTGPTPLIAAMRAFVMAKMGAAVDIPDQLEAVE